MPVGIPYMRTEVSLFLCYKKLKDESLKFKENKK